jgi:hypothetical protein
MNLNSQTHRGSRAKDVVGQFDLQSISIHRVINNAPSLRWYLTFTHGSKTRSTVFDAKLI